MNLASVAGALLLALAAAISATVLGIALWLLLTPAIMEHGPVGPIEPAWLPMLTALASSLLGGFVATRAKRGTRLTYLGR